MYEYEIWIQNLGLEMWVLRWGNDIEILRQGYGIWDLGSELCDLGFGIRDSFEI